MIKNRLSIVVLAAACLQSACGSNSNTSNTGSGCVDISGTWDVTQVEDDTQCGGGKVTTVVTGSGTQTGCSFTVISEGETLTGTATGNQFSGSFTESELGGTGNGTFTGTVSADGKTFVANSSWTWQQGTTSCRGTTVSTATRISGSPDAG